MRSSFVIRCATGILALTLLALAAASPATAQGTALVGSWIYRSDRGRPIGVGGSNSILFQFRADGGFQQKIIFPGGEVNYVGQYQLTPQMTLFLRYLDFSPKQDCRYGYCYPNQTAIRPGTTFNPQIQVVSATRFLLQDASGPQLYVRLQ